MFKTKKYYILFLIPVLVLFFTMPFASCNPYRKGSVMKGRDSKMGKHKHTATSKRKRR